MRTQEEHGNGLDHTGYLNMPDIYAFTISRNCSTLGSILRTRKSMEEVSLHTHTYVVLMSNATDCEMASHNITFLASPFPFSKRFYAKELVWQHFATLFPADASNVWLLDDDIDLTAEAVVEAARTPYPLLHPIVHGGGTNGPRQRPDNISGSGCVALGVEQSAVRIHASFFHELMGHPHVLRLLDMHRQLEIDWGIDCMWCPILRQRGHDCYLLNKYVLHRDFRTVRKSPKYFRAGDQILRTIAEWDPQYEWSQCSVRCITMSSKDGGRGRGPSHDSSQEHERRGELYQERDDGRSMHSKGVTNTIAHEGARAVVLKTRFLCECRVQRLLALSQVSQMLNVDVWVLHDESMGHEVAKQVNDLAASNGRIFVAKTPSIDLDRYPPFFESERKDLIWPFINWLNQSNYDFAWYVEDDFVFTGDWSSYFGPAEQEAGRADLVAKYRNTNAQWAWSGSCKLRRQNCLQNNRIVQSKLALHRMSRRFAARMLHLRALRQLQGRDEALVALICDEWVECTRSPLYFQGGVYQPGHWGPFQSNSSARPYTLRGLAAFDEVTSTFNFAKYSTNADVPRDRLYHPVKCEAERQWEGKSLVDKTAPQPSLLAPQLSGRKGFGSTRGYKDRDSQLGHGPTATTKKDTVHRDLKRAGDRLQGKKQERSSRTETAWQLRQARRRMGSPPANFVPPFFSPNRHAESA